MGNLALVNALNRDALRAGLDSYFADAGYSPRMKEAMIEATLEALKREFESLLPDGCTWAWNTTTITGSHGLSDDEIISLMISAQMAVAHQLPEIEDRVRAECGE